MDCTSSRYSHVPCPRRDDNNASRAHSGECFHASQWPDRHVKVSGMVLLSATATESFVAMGDPATHETVGRVRACGSRRARCAAEGEDEWHEERTRVLRQRSRCHPVALLRVLWVPREAFGSHKYCPADISGDSGEIACDTSLGCWAQLDDTAGSPPIGWTGSRDRRLRRGQVSSGTRSTRVIIVHPRLLVGGSHIAWHTWPVVFFQTTGSTLRRGSDWLQPAGAQHTHSASARTRCRTVTEHAKGQTPRRKVSMRCLVFERRAQTSA